MPIEDALIPSPVLDPRTEAQFIAEAIYYGIGGVSQDQCHRNIAIWEEVDRLIQTKGIQKSPLVSELVGAHVGDAHVVLLTNILRSHVETRYRFNQLTEKVHIELLRQSGITLQPTAAATTTLEFI